MAITTQQVKSLLVSQVGECPDSRLVLNVDLLWQTYSQYGAIYPPLQRGYTRLGLIDLALGYYRLQVDTEVEGTSFRYQQRITTLGQMRADAEAEVASLWQQARASRGGTVAPITAVEPLVPPDQRPVVPLPSDDIDAFDEAAQGSPYFPQNRSVG